MFPGEEIRKWDESTKREHYVVDIAERCVGWWEDCFEERGIENFELIGI